MELITVTDWVGYAAMATVLISFLMKKVNNLRLVNSVGCLLFVVYGFMLNPLSYPIIITNTAIFLINLYYLALKKR
ncbi:uroporphyrinogen decarboxylase [Hanstruepera flava]|uniref:uroporphyrinogen decarboxylase n=1 Tax=Hanstruepera flava TaxID=2930218 RepID=UPI0020298B30|nr:uroporphyrinogen decarboxylase [Hanstruepera flava]